MPSYKTMIDNCNRTLDDQYDNADYVGWFNEALEVLTDLLFIPARATVAPDVNSQYFLPSDVNYNSKPSIRKVGSTAFMSYVPLDSVSEGIYLFGSEIYRVNSGDTGSLEVFYNKKPTMVDLNSLDLMPEFDSSYHYLIQKYAQAQIAIQEEEVDVGERYGVFWNEFQEGKEKLTTFMDKLKSESSKVVEWTVIR